MSEPKSRFFNMGTYGATATGDAFDVSDLENVTVIWSGTYVGSVYVEISHDGTNFATAPGFSDIHVANTPGSFTLPYPVKQLRFRFARSSGTVYAHFKGDPRKTGKYVSGTLGSVTAQATGTAVDIGHLEGVTITWSGTYVADFGIQISMDGTRFAPLPDNACPTTAAGSYRLTTPAKQMRVYCPRYWSGTAYVRYGGLDEDR